MYQAHAISDKDSDSLYVLTLYFYTYVAASTCDIFIHIISVVSLVTYILLTLCAYICLLFYTICVPLPCHCIASSLKNHNKNISKDILKMSQIVIFSFFFTSPAPTCSVILYIKMWCAFFVLKCIVSAWVLLVWMALHERVIEQIHNRPRGRLLCLLFCIAAQAKHKKNRRVLLS